MGKVIGAIATIALAIVVAVAAPMLAPGIVGLFGVSTSIATAIAASVISIAGGLLLGALMPKPSSTNSPTDIRQSVSDSQLIIGKCRVGAKLAFFYPKKSGSSYYRYFVWVVAGHRVNGLTKWYLNDLEITVDGSGKILHGPYTGHGWLWFDRGDENAQANGTFVAECDGKWTAAHQGRGIAKIYAKFEMTDAIVQAGMPNITAEIQGSDEILDPRTNTTGYTNNAILAFYWWMTLPRTEGGFGCYPDEIDWDWVAAQANVCDEDVAVGSTRSSLVAAGNQGATTLELDSVTGLAVGMVVVIGGPGQLLDRKHVSAINAPHITVDSGLPRPYGAGTQISWADTAGSVTEKRYGLDGFMTTGADPSSVRDVLVANMAGRFTYSGGLMLARPGYWVPSSATLSEDDLAAAFSIDLLTGGDSHVTEVDASWNDPSNMYQQVDLPSRSSGDANVAQATLDLPFVKSRARAERIQKIKLLQSSGEKKVTWPMNIAGLGIGPMDTVQLGTTRYGLSNYAFTVTSWSLSQDFAISLKLQEENPDMYEWDPADESDVAVVDKIPSAEIVPDATAGRASFRIVSQTVAYPVTSTDTEIDVVAFTGVLDDGRQINFPAGAIAGLTAGTSYAVLWDLTANAYLAAISPALTQVASSQYAFVTAFSTSTNGTHAAATDAPPGAGGDGQISQ